MPMDWSTIVAHIVLVIGQVATAVIATRTHQAVNGNALADVAAAHERGFQDGVESERNHAHNRRSGDHH